MPKQSGRGKVLRTRTVKVSRKKYMRCDVYEEAGPRGGKTVCGPVKTVKSAKKGRK